MRIIPWLRIELSFLTYSLRLNVLDSLPNCLVHSTIHTISALIRGKGLRWSQDQEVLKIITHPDKVKMRCTFWGCDFFQILSKINLSDNYNSSRRSENEVQVLRLWFILFLSQINITDKKKILYNLKNVTHFHHF